MWSLMVNGSALMLPILVCSVGAVLLFLERVFHLHRARIQQEDFLSGIYTVVNRGNMAEAVSICDQTPGPVAHMVRIALLHADEEPEELKETITKAGLNEIPRLERNMGGLLTIAQISPLLGLLGTVVGLIGVFMALEGNGPLVEIRDLSGGMRQALATTAFGLCVSIPSFAGYNFLVSRVERITLDMEYVAEEIYRFIVHGRVNGGAGKNGHV
jgi:biopolymer transport protein ExbB